MSRINWLADVLRNAGLQVVEVSGWMSRGSETFNPQGVIIHATAGSRTASNASELRVILEGSSSAPPPISQLMLGRDGTWYVVASGRCNHALQGWGGNLSGLGNSSLIGIEGCNNNLDEAWGPAQYDSYVRGVAAICKHLGWDPARKISGHKEHQPGAKTDPTFNMNDFRAAVSHAMNSPVPAPTQRKNNMATLYVQAGTTVKWALAGDSPGTPANWLETTEVNLANQWANAHGNNVHLSSTTWDDFKARYLAPVSVADNNATT